MIVFTVAFGESYIRKLFERSLPSLMGPRGLPSVQGENVKLVIYTFNDSMPLINSYLGREELRFFNKAGNLQVIAMNAKQPGDAQAAPKTQGRSIASSLLAHAVAEVARSNEIFFHLSPDIVYGDGVVDSCYQLHKLTGRNVVVFNGRVAPAHGMLELATAALLQAARTSSDLAEYFFQNMNFKWRLHATQDPSRIPGPTAGNLIYQSSAMRLIFCSTPNPVLGKFNTADVSVLSDSDCMHSWDHYWVDFLAANNRLMVQTNLNNGMSIEPEPAFKDEKHFLESQLDGVARAGTLLGIQEQELRRHRKFNGPHNFCFTSTASL